MVEGFVPKPEPANSCCKEWKDKLTDVEEKRNTLREAVKLLQHQINKIQAENIDLVKGYGEEKARAATEREGKDKESAVRLSLEREILDLKSQISSLRQNAVDAVNVRGEVDHLNALVAEGKKEISQLKELLKTERKRIDVERKNAEARKKEAAQALKTVQIERSKVSDLRNFHKIQMDNVSECRQQLGMLKKEYEETKLKLASETSKLIEVNKDLEIEKRRTSKERERSNSEISKAQASRIQAEANRKQVEEVKSRAENLFQQLERKTRRIEELQKQVKELQTLNFFIESCCGQHDKKTNSKAVEKNDEPWMEMIQRNASELKLVLKNLKAKEVNITHKLDGDLAIMKDKAVDSNMMKSSEQKNHLEIYRKKAVDEQCRADKLALELEEEKKKVEELQKKLCELKSSRKLVDASAVSFEHATSSERGEMKLLKKKLKFERTRLKHAREVANLEKTNRFIIQQELGRFKLEVAQLSNHLDNLHKFVVTGTKGNDDLEKTKSADSLQSLYSEKNLYAIESFKTWIPDTFRQIAPQHGAPLLPLSEGNHITSLSGIESRLESHTGDSNRKVLQSCAVNSSTSFSDGQLVGSQEKLDLCLPAAMQPKISNLSGEVSKMKSDENLAMMAENSVRSPIKNHVGRPNGQQQKRKRTIEPDESIECLYHESRKMHSQIEEKLSLLHALNSPTEKPLEKSGDVISNVLQDSSADKKVQTKRKILYRKQTRVQQLLDDNEMKLNKDDTEVCVLECIGRQPSKPFSKLTDSCQPCLEELNNSVISELETLETVGNIADGDYMKLLDLDSAADEERYRRAMEMPLSPLLPDIYIPVPESFALNDFEPLVNELHKEFPNEGQPQFHSYDVMDVETKSNYTQSCNSGLVGDTHSSKRQLDLCLMQESHETDLCDIVQAEKNCLNKVGVIVGMPETNVSLSSCEGVGTSNIKSGTKDNSIPDFCVLFSATKDYHSISTIFSVTRACIKRSSLTSQKDWMVQEILASLNNMEHKLLPKEKTCVFFSLLLLNFTVVVVHKYGHFLNCNTFSDSFSVHICEAMLDVKIRSLFTESLCLDELLALIEDFILNGQVLSCTDACFETLTDGVFSVNIPIDGVNRTLSLAPASTNYLIAGSSILASISKAVHRIGLLWEVSYSILRICKYESLLVLTILHIFAHIGGDQFFSVEGYSTLMAVLKSIIMHLEVVGSSDDATFTPPKRNCRTEFVQCANCPFSEEVMSMPMVVSLLLQLIQKNISNEILAENLGNPTSSLNPEPLCEKNLTNQIQSKNLSGTVVPPVSCLDRDASCCLMKYKVSDDESHSLFNPTRCAVADSISLVELLACYMSWNWTFVNIISQLLELLKSSVKDSLPIVILLGQLGRLGVAAGGFEDGRVKTLRSNLSSFLCLDTTIKSGFCVQIAIVSALLGLLPFEFETIVQEDKVSYPASSSQYIEVNLIKTWFSFLSPKQKEMSCNILQVAVCNVS